MPISVAKGKRLIIKFKLKYEGTRAFDGLTTRVAIKGWNSSVRKNFGYVPRNSISEFELIWDNKSGNCSIDYFDICFLLYSNANPSGSWIFWFLYDSLKVTVEDIPISKQDIINNQNENTDKIIDNQNQNTDKEIQAEKDQYELEKQEAQKSGDESVDGALSAMPNDSDGIISSFDNLLSCMLHTNTNCNITFPELKTPAICGIPSYTVSKKVMFGIDQIPQYIPNSILYLVRALLTIALILYCYKELYSTIQYIVSLKKGGTDE